MARDYDKEINELEEIGFALKDLEKALRRFGDADNADFIEQLKDEYSEKQEAVEAEYYASPEYREFHPFYTTMDNDSTALLFR